MLSEKKRMNALHTKAYLRKKEVIWKQFDPSFPTDHAFCVFCWSQISCMEEDIHNGYFEPISESWICNSCFSEYQDFFAWVVQTPSLLSEQESLSATEIPLL